MAKAGKTQVVEVQALPMDAVGFPARSLKLPLGAKRSAFVFTMTDAQRDQLGDNFVETAKRLGDLVHPHQAVLVVLPGEAPDLRAYKVRAAR